MRIVARIQSEHIYDTGVNLNKNKVKFSCCKIDNSKDLYYIIDDVKYPFISQHYMSFSTDLECCVILRNVVYASIFG